MASPHRAVSSSPVVRAARLLAALALAGVLSGVAPARARAEDAPAPPVAPKVDEEKQEAIDRQVDRGWAAFRRGNHEEALTRMDRLAGLDPAHPLPRYLKARVLTRTGKYLEALDHATAAVLAAPGDRAAEAARFDLLERLGRHDEALAAATAALADRPDDLVARDARARALEERGRRAEALAEYDRVIAAYNEGSPPDAEIPAVVHAALRATWLSQNAADDLVLSALKILSKRIEAEPENVDLLLALADVYQANRGSKGQGIAQKHYKKILDQNHAVVEARVGLARSLLLFYDEAGAASQCRKALDVNPSFVPAMSVLAAIHVGDGDYDKADGLWDRAKKVNPRDKEARSVRAARLLIGGDRAAFEALAAEVLRDDPTYGRLYSIAAELVGERQRRYDVAAELAKKATEVDPSDAVAYVVLGESLLNLGREDEGRAVLLKGVEASKRYGDVVRDNYLEVLDVLETFVENRSENFVLRQHPEEAAVMTPYLLPLLEQAWADLSKKYDFVPQGPVLVESFHRHDDFSARSVGAPNIPALGVCFGQLITLDGPLSRPLGEFSWAPVAWHEFAHVVTLQMSKGQVPRWLTEGLSVHEEKAHDPLWGRGMEKQLHDRWRNGRLLKMSEINHAFRGPDVMFAYYQGGLIADYVTKEWGFQAIQKMLRRFADDVTTEKVFDEVLKTPLADFDRRFEAYVSTLVGDYKLVPRWDDESKTAFEVRTKANPADAEAWTRLGWALHQRGVSIDAGAAVDKAKALAPDAPELVLLQGEIALRAKRLDVAKERFEKFLSLGGDDFGARVALAQIAMEERKSADAVRHYEAAASCFPRYSGKRSNPFLELSKLYEGEGNTAKSVEALSRYAENAPDDFEVRKTLLDWYVEKKDDAAVLATCRELVQINPFGATRKKRPDLEVHARYAEALTRAGRKEDAVREWRVQSVLVGLLPEEDRAKAGGVTVRVTLADLLLELKRPEEALDAALGAVAIDPGSVEARAAVERARAAGGDR
jgi:tetratricopeptide (TPR) repeat protein